MEQSFDHIRFYRFFFKELKKPITIEAASKDSALRRLNEVTNRLSIGGQVPYDEDIITPIKGVSTKIKDHKKMVWVGGLSTDGWLNEDEYKKVSSQFENEN